MDNYRNKAITGSVNTILKAFPSVDVASIHTLEATSTDGEAFKIVQILYMQVQFKRTINQIKRKREVF